MNPERRSIDLVEHDEPELAEATDVRLRMLEVGVCGTDREIAAFEYGDPPPGSEHLVIGHESLAEVVRLGRGHLIAAWQPGGPHGSSALPPRLLPAMPVGSPGFLLDR